MKLNNIEGLIVIDPKIFHDARGYFFESFHTEKYRALGIETEFVQDNISVSNKGVLRGLHFQKPPYAQAKLVQVLAGIVYDVVVDLRSTSATFGAHYGILLSAINKKQLYIPKGFAHGFLVLSDTAVFQYKCDAYYTAEADSGIYYGDKDIAIEWPMSDNLIVSDKDKNLQLFIDYQLNPSF